MSGPAVDLLPDDLALARSQLASGLATLAEGVLVRHIARIEVSGRGALDELDAARSLLAEALWRQGRAIAAGAVVNAIRAGSVERKRPIVMLIEAEAAAAGGEPERAARLAERVVAAVGIDEAWRLRGGVASRIAWPAPLSFRTPASWPRQPPSGRLRPTRGSRRPARPMGPGTTRRATAS